MRVMFHDPQKPLRAQTEQQEIMRRTPIRRRRLWPFFVLLLLLVACGILFSHWLRGHHIRTYGLVAGPIETTYAPFAGKVEGLDAQVGDVLAQGEELLTLSPLLPAAAAEARQRVLEEFDAAASEESSAALAVAQAEAEVKRIEEEISELGLRRDYERALAEAEVRKLEDFAAAKVKRLERLRQLFAMDAALRADVDSAAHEAEQARHNLAQARIALDFARRVDSPMAARLEAARLKVAEAKLRGTVPEELARARFLYETAAGLPEPLVVAAPFPAVLTELAVSRGAVVEAGRLLGTFAAQRGLAVEAYVPLKQAHLLEPGLEVRVEAPGYGVEFDAEIESMPGPAARVPLALRYYFEDGAAAFVLRLDLPEDVTLIPGTPVRVSIR